MAENAINEAAVEAKGRTAAQKLVKGMKEKLAACKKVRIKVPIDKQNEKDLYVTAQVNGYTFQIKRGEYVEVPEPVAKQLERAGHI